MKFFTVLSTLFVLAYRCQGYRPLVTLFNGKRYSSATKRDPDVQTPDIIESFGYPVETHAVETQDGYILTMHRIPQSRNNNGNGVYRTNPVFLQHGILGSSVDFFLLSTRDALPFMLADLGYDVWLGNIRGTTYSQRHMKYLPTENEFWNYTWHDAALNDLPAMVDYVLELTSSKKVAYIGFSMGSTMFLVLASMEPKIASKIEVAMLMAPIAFSSHVKSPLLRFLAPISKTGPLLSHLIATGEFQLTHYTLQLFTRYFCAVPVFDEAFCRRHIFLIFGADYTQYNPRTVSRLLNHYPAGLSAKALNHFAQLIKSAKFQQYDYGTRINYQRYGAAYPPDYNLTKIQISTYMYVGRNDFLAPLEDVNHTVKFMTPVVKGFTVIPDPNFSHLDFLAGVDVSNTVYKPMISDMMQELRDTS